jgi:hypothetical protein
LSAGNEAKLLRIIRETAAAIGFDADGEDRDESVNRSFAAITRNAFAIAPYVDNMERAFAYGVVLFTYWPAIRPALCEVIAGRWPEPQGDGAQWVDRCLVGIGWTERNAGGVGKDIEEEAKRFGVTAADVLRCAIDAARSSDALFLQALRQEARRPQGAPVDGEALPVALFATIDANENAGTQEAEYIRRTKSNPVAGIRRAISTQNGFAAPTSPDTLPVKSLDAYGVDGGTVTLRRHMPTSVLTPQERRDQVLASWSSYLSLSPRAAMMLDAMVHFWNCRPPGADSAEVTIDDLISHANALQEKARGDGRRGGYEPEQRRLFLEAVQVVCDLYLHAPYTLRARRGRPAVSGVIEGRLFDLAFFSTSPGESGAVVPGLLDGSVHAILFRPGTAAAAVLEEAARNFLMSPATLNRRNVARRGAEILLGNYLVEQFDLAAEKVGTLGFLTCKAETLLRRGEFIPDAPAPTAQQLSIVFDSPPDVGAGGRGGGGKDWRAVDRLERALSGLVGDVITDWGYHGPNGARPLGGDGAGVKRWPGRQQRAVWFPGYRVDARIWVTPRRMPGVVGRPSPAEEVGGGAHGDMVELRAETLARITAKGISQKAAAKGIGMPRPTLSYFLSKGRPLSPGNAKKVRQWLKGGS